MANRIYIKMYNPISKKNNDIIESPLQEDIQWDISTTYMDVGELFPSGLDTILSLYQLGSQITGKTDKSINNLIGQPIWQKTDPLKISTSLVFYTKTNPLTDVMNPTLGLCSLNVMDDTKNNSYRVPGLNFGDNKFMRMSNSAESVTSDTDYSQLFTSATRSTVCSVLIPGVIFLPVALIMTGKPTFSKEVCAMPGLLDFRKFPLWAKIEIEVRSITPATLSMITSQVGLRDQAFAELVAMKRK